MKTTFAMAALAAVALLVTACGDDDSAEGTTAASETTAAAETTAAPDTTAAPESSAAPETTAAPENSAAPTEGVDLSDLTVDAGSLEAAVECGDAGDAGTVLLVHGTGTTPAEAFGPSLSATLPPFGYEVCTVELPGRSTVDIQDSTEYVVGAVRSITDRTGQPVALVAHSQGVLQARSAVAFWSDVAERVSMIVAVGGPNAGSEAVIELCAAGCVPALWQMTPGSDFLTALDTAWADVDMPVTVVRTLTDEFVGPDSAAAIPGASVVTIQDWCVDRQVSHAGQLVDPVGHAGITSALANGGTAQDADIEAVGCTETVVDNGDLAGVDAAAAAAFGAVLGGEFVDAEPAVRLG